MYCILFGSVHVAEFLRFFFSFSTPVEKLQLFQPSSGSMMSMPYDGNDLRIFRVWQLASGMSANWKLYIECAVEMITILLTLN